MNDKLVSVKWQKNEDLVSGFSGLQFKTLVKKRREQNKIKPSQAKPRSYTIWKQVWLSVTNDWSIVMTHNFLMNCRKRMSSRVEESIRNFVYNLNNFCNRTEKRKKKNQVLAAKAFNQTSYSSYSSATAVSMFYFSYYVHRWYKHQY